MKYCKGARVSNLRPRRWRGRIRSTRIIDVYAGFVKRKSAWNPKKNSFCQRPWPDERIGKEGRLPGVEARRPSRKSAGQYGSGPGRRAGAIVAMSPGGLAGGGGRGTASGPRPLLLRESRREAGEPTLYYKVMPHFSSSRPPRSRQGRRSGVKGACGVGNPARQGRGEAGEPTLYDKVMPPFPLSSPSPRRQGAAAAETRPAGQAAAATRYAG
jgi:hypothetical protein